MLLVDGDLARRDSDAIIAVPTGLGGAWRLAGALRIVPGLLRHPLYRCIARHRYRWFGRREQCLLPDAALRERFLRTCLGPDQGWSRIFWRSRSYSS